MRRAAWLVAMLCFAGMARAEVPDFVEKDSCAIVFPGGRSAAIDRFVDKLDSVMRDRRGRVSILHIGGSHVQADIYTNVIRQSLDSLNGTMRPPRGFVFPYSAAKTNNPWNYKTSFGGEWEGRRNALRQFSPALGLGGIAALTSDTAAWLSVTLNTDTLMRWQAREVRLFGESLHGHGRPRLVVDGKSLSAQETDGESYVFRADSLFGQFEVRIDFDSEQAAEPDTFVVRGMLTDNDEAGVVYHTVGVNGASVPSYLGCERLEDDLRHVRPDMVIFAIGINDATAQNFTDSLFVANYDSLIVRIRSVVPDCALLFISNNDSYQRRARGRLSVNENGLVAQRAFCELARKWQGGFWDLFAIMGGLGSMKKWEEAGLAKKDRVHFTPKGYELVGELFSQAFLDFYKNYDLPTNDDN